MNIFESSNVIRLNWVHFWWDTFALNLFGMLNYASRVISTLKYHSSAIFPPLLGTLSRVESQFIAGALQISKSTYEHFLWGGRKLDYAELCTDQNKRSWRSTHSCYCEAPTCCVTTLPFRQSDVLFFLHSKCLCSLLVGWRCSLSIRT